MNVEYCGQQLLAEVGVLRRRAWLAWGRRKAGLVLLRLRHDDAGIGNRGPISRGGYLLCTAVEVEIFVPSSLS